MWILGKDLIVTAFPQRWQQPKNDPLNVLDGIIENINSNTRDPVSSVYDLAMIITSRCSGIFDRHRMGDEDYQFLDMFESSIGEATEKETSLFEDFNAASKKASAWLQHHRRPNRFSRHLEAEGRHLSHRSKTKHAAAPTSSEPYPPDAMGPTHSPLFVDELLDIGDETDLLTEIKDIRDEIAMILKVLDDQRSVHELLSPLLHDVYAASHTRQTPLKRATKDLALLLKNHATDLSRLDTQASRIYTSITDLLDLKQKHANAFEARFARDQAAGTARQSQTIMVFTIVTIIFLPLSFMAALFTINVREFPHQPGGDQPSLPLGWVVKWMFGVGVAVSVPLVGIAVSLDAIGDAGREVRRRWGEWRTRRRRGDGDDGREEREKPQGYTVDVDALERALSSARGRPSLGSYLGGGGSVTLLPVGSRGTAASRSPDKRSVVVSNGAADGVRRGNSAGRSAARRPGFQERGSTGFRIRQSLDVERGL